MNVKTAALCFFCLIAPGFVDAKLYLLLDERLRKTPIEQAIYKFVPLTNASEVELNYVQSFMKDDAWRVFAVRLKRDDNGMYIGADQWPEETHLAELTQSRAWLDHAGKISFLIENNAPEFARMPRGLYSRRELWKRYADLTDAGYAGSFDSHYLDATQNELKGADWRGMTCVHESGKVLKAGKASPLLAGKNQFQLHFRLLRQLDFIGGLVCINTPKADTIFEVHTVKTDVELEAEPGRFSIWNEAQPLRIRIKSARQITSPLALQIVPEVNQTQTEFFFQGERITCTSGRCRKRDARFLLPQFRDFTESFEFAIRAPGDSYFRGTLRLMAGEIEIARSPVRFTPMSWVAETSYALKNPSEYQSVFFLLFALTLVAAGLIVLLWYGLKKAALSLAEKAQYETPKQSSATATIDRDVTYRMTAGENPFGCELYGFGGIVALRVAADSVAVQHGGTAEQRFPLAGFRYGLPDGYVLEIKILPDGKLLLEAYLLDVAVLSRA